MTKILFIVLLFVGVKAVAQTNTFPASGSVGIGTLSPAGTLHIYGPLDGSLPSIAIGSTNTGNLNVPFGGSPGGYHIDFLTWRDVVPNQVGARIRGERINQWENNSALKQSMDLVFYTSIGIDQSYLLEQFRIKSDGNVGIGTATPSDKLSVNGTIRAKEVKVETANWPDYVFEKDYDLSSLASLEAYILKNKHLPNIPSATDIANQGQNLGELNAKLLKTVEELTLLLSKKINS